MRKFLISLSLSVVLVCSTSAQSVRNEVIDDDLSTCSNITLDNGIRGLPVELRQSGFRYISGGTTIPVISLRNSQPTPILSIVLVLDYTDGSGKSLERIPFLASTSGRPSVPFPTQEVQSLDASIRPGEEVYLAPSFEGRALDSCPLKAIVKYAQLHFGDGREVTLKAANWSVDAMPKLVPPIPEKLLQVLPRFPFDAVVSATIDKDGRITAVSGSEQSTDVITWTRQFLSMWRFYPAIQNGKSISSVEKFLVVGGFAPDNHITVPEGIPPMLIRLLRGADPSDPERPVVYFGNARENSFFSTNAVMPSPGTPR